MKKIDRKRTDGDADMPNLLERVGRQAQRAIEDGEDARHIALGDHLEKQLQKQHGENVTLPP